jgi:hypothetical protein
LFYTDDFSGGRTDSQAARAVPRQPGGAKRDNRLLLVGQVYPGSILIMNKQLDARAECLRTKKTRNVDTRQS